MGTTGVADVVFCIDASASMAHCFRAVSDHIADFLAGLKADRQTRWDVRFDFVAHCAGETSDAGVIARQRSMYCDSLIDSLYLSAPNQPAFGRRLAAPRFF